MAFSQNISNVSISLDTAAVEGAEFKYPLFIAAHRYFSERIREYTTTSSVSEDIPSGSPAYKALTAALSQSPRPASVFLGRAEADASLAPTGVANGKVYTTTITVNDGDSVAVSVTATTGQDAEDVVDAMLVAIAADTDVSAHITATKVGTGTSATLSIVATVEGTDYFVLSNVSSNLTVSYTSTETPETTLSEIEEESTAWYGVAAEDHSETYVLAMAEAIEARTKIYLVSLQNAESLVALADPIASGDIAGELSDANYFRTAWMYHQDADTEFPEMAWLGRCLSYDVGTETWANKILSGVGVSRDATTGKKLSATQKSAIAGKNGNFIHLEGGQAFTREGKMASGEWIDVIRLRDAIENDINVNMLTLQLQNSKVPYTDIGITKITTVVKDTLDYYTATEARTGGLESSKVYFKRAANISAADKASRVLDSVSFVAYLAGAIHVTQINGSLTYSGT